MAECIMTRDQSSLSGREAWGALTALVTMLRFEERVTVSRPNIRRGLRRCQSFHFKSRKQAVGAVLIQGSDRVGSKRVKSGATGDIKSERL